MKIHTPPDTGKPAATTLREARDCLTVLLANLEGVQLDDEHARAALGLVRADVQAAARRIVRVLSYLTAGR